MSPILIEWIGAVAATLSTTAFLPQAIRTIKSRRTQDISLWTQLLLFSGIIIWLIYGVLINSWPLIIANCVSFFFVGTVLALKIRYG